MWGGVGVQDGEERVLRRGSVWPMLLCRALLRFSIFLGTRIEI